MSNLQAQEMDICREYCSVISRKRAEAGFNSLKYPLVSVKLNRYFLPVYRDIIAEECNLVGYGDEIPAVEYWEEEEPYEVTNNIKVSLDTSTSEWQMAMYNARVERRKENELKRQHDNKS